MTLWIGRLLLLSACAVCLTQLIRSRAAALALPVSLAACGALAMLLLPRLAEIRGELEGLAQAARLDTALFLPVVKVLAIVEITHLGAELCRDGGEKALAAQLELCGTAAAVICVLPLARQALALLGAIGS